MVLTKPVKYKRKGGGNSAPQKRESFPDIDQHLLDCKLDDYIRTMGIAKAFDLENYKHLEVQQAQSPQAMFKLHLLLDSLLSVSPTCQIKFRNLKQSLEVAAKNWGWELLQNHWGLKDQSQLTGRAADSMGVLMNHWRRVTGTEEAWVKFCEKLNKAQAQCMERLYKKTECKKGRSLKKEVSDVSLDSQGFPQILAAEVADDVEESGEEVGGGETSEDECGKEALAAKPPPVLKKHWYEAAGKSKKKPAASSKAAVLKSGASDHHKPKPEKMGNDKIKVDQKTLSMGGGKNQSYIQHQPNGDKSKRLIVAVTKSQASATKKPIKSSSPTS